MQVEMIKIYRIRLHVSISSIGAGELAQCTRGQTALQENPGFFHCNQVCFLTKSCDYYPRRIHLFSTSWPLYTRTQPMRSQIDAHK